MTVAAAPLETVADAGRDFDVAAWARRIALPALAIAAIGWSRG